MACYMYDLGTRAKCDSLGTCLWPNTWENLVYNEEIYKNSSVPPTEKPPDEPSNMLIGFIVTFASVVLFSLMFIPVKKFDCSDGVFYQFIMCNAALAVGMIVNVVRGMPTVYPLALLSGFLWCTGNMLCVPIIQFLGMGLGLLLWNSSNMVMGWAGGKFGLFGITPQPPDNLFMNYAGVVLALLSAVLFVCIKPNVSPELELGNEEIGSNMPTVARTSSTRDEYDGSIPYHLVNSTNETQISFSNNGQMKKRILGCFFSVFSGLMFGNTFTPIIYIQDHPEIYPGASKNGLDYIFTYYLGVYITSLFYFIIYCLIKRNRPWISAELILPSFITGIMWAVGQACFLLASQYLSEPVSFPIIASGPGILAAIVGMIFFREITGRRNYLFLAAAFVCVVTGAVLSGLSKG